MVNKWIVKSVAVLGTACLSAFGGTLTPNKWQAVDGDYNGSWGDVRHWSLGHLPTTGEYAYFDAWTLEGQPNRWIEYSVSIDADYVADLLWLGINGTYSLEGVTFTGSGSLTFTGASYDSNDPLARNMFCRYLRGLTVDGPAVECREAGVLANCPLAVKNGGLFKAPTYHLWNDESSLSIESRGTVEIVGNLGYGYTPNNDNYSAIVGSNAVLRIGGQLGEGDSRYATRRFNMKIDGGSVSMGKLNFSRGTEMLDFASGELTLDDMALAAGAALHVGEDTRFVLNHAPTVGSDELVVFDGGDIEFNFDVNCDGDTFITRLLANPKVRSLNYRIVCKTGPEPIKSDAPFTTLQFRNLDTGSNQQNIDLDEIVFQGGATYPFYWLGNRQNNIYGPTRISALSDMTHSGCNAYLYCYGPMTVDTSVAKVYLRGVVSGNSSLELTVTGGGTARIDPAFTYNVIDTLAVTAGTTLELGDCYLGSQGQNYEWTRLVADTFSLGAGAVLKFNAQAQSVSAANWSIDGSARIVVAAPTSFTYGAFPILHDLESKALPDAFLAQIEVTGNEQGLWQLRNEFGQISLCRDYPAGTYAGKEWEWKGGDGNLFTNINNWVKSSPPEYMEQTDGPHYFGAATSRRIYVLGKMRRSSVPDFGGAAINGWTFLDNATGSYFLYGGVQHNMNKSIQNFSPLPQVIGISLRWWTPEFYSQGFGPIVISSDNGLGGNNANFNRADANGGLYIKGDVRFGIAFAQPKLSAFFESQYPAILSSLTVIPGGDFTFLKQNANIGLSKRGMFRVAENATLTFASDAAAFYRLTTCAPASFINGTMNINVPFYGGVNQGYRGKGTLNIASTRSGTASSRVEFGGALTVRPASWETVTADNAAAAVAISVRGRPTLKVQDGWTYGTASGVSTTTTADERALRIEAGSVLTVDPDGGAATIDEDVAGEGALVITNGTLAVNSSAANGVSLKVAAGGVLALSNNLNFGSLELQAGSAIAPSADLKDRHGWQTVLVAADGVTDSGCALPAGCEMRTEAVEGGVALQLRFVQGSKFIVL